MAVLQACTTPDDRYVRAKWLDQNGNEVSMAADSTITVSQNQNSGSGSSGQINYLLTIDLNSSDYKALANVGGYIIQSRIVVAQVSSGVYAAATQTCSHEPRNRVVFRNNEWYCTDHGARFSLNGAGLNQRGSRGLSVFKVTQEGSILYIS